MTKQELQDLFQKGPIILDGATGSNLMAKGMPMGVCPEDWIYHHKEAIVSLQKAYVEAGTQILYAPTFTANRIKLAEYDMEDRLEELNRAMVRYSREAAGDRAFVAGDLTMTGRQLYPVGDLMFEDLVDVYKEQVRAILKEGVDLFVIETMMSLQECRAALLAVKETCDLPVMISLTYNEDGRTLYGTSPEIAMVVLEHMGADIVGVNCSTGPLAMIPLVKAMLPYADIPIMVKPNAGMPELENGETVYKMTPEEFADACEQLVDAGASVVGGCCGTRPDHIKALADRMRGKKVEPIQKKNRPVLTSERGFVEVTLDGGFKVVGERINPTGKKALQEELRSGSMQMVRQFARDQEIAGAAILDVNMGTNGIDEKATMLDAIYEVISTVDLPLSIDTSYVDVMEAALRIYPGRALINSISCEAEKMKELLPIAKKYGAMFVLLPLSQAGLPKDLDEKKEHITHVLEAARAIGLQDNDAVVDVLVATVGANPSAALECFETISYCKDTLHLPTICGLSNISFGMPQRIFVNTAFLNVALSKGLTMAIANPSQELLMYTALATDLLLGKEGASERYLGTVPTTAMKMVGSKDVKVDSQTKEEAHHPIFDCVVKGDKESIIREVKKEVEAGEKPSAVIEKYLIPGINQVGEYYDNKKYFLPQLIAGANAMKEAMEYLEPLLLADKKDEAKATVVIATVEGDIHDIGKNLVVLMLKNYGYRVFDMGKDVPAESIVNKAIEENAQIIGLSALMTTTMMRMKDVVDLAKEKGCQAKIIIGGACITESFAEEIGADGYSKDASECVKLIDSLIQSKL
ncbi:5-methyltetrahydrofolate--homocysteine methyltransferase [Roseburia sp. AM51-8]|uniref:homocysteine S-methyltransferase family protein n=1 Tax=Roseburia sp. AM51-8 TaxID=2292366 RepID=UPI000E4F35B3|nr:homocysteine S-methyltransferase family protein [Roseburia sp. AM51-8]RHP99301.1 5-methyltetrahydrofolate--homocysteine methyltransferase [Roseburia sp. AM51-8]